MWSPEKTTQTQFPDIFRSLFKLAGTPLWYSGTPLQIQTFRSRGLEGKTMFLNHTLLMQMEVSVQESNLTEAKISGYLERGFWTSKTFGSSYVNWVILTSSGS